MEPADFNFRRIRRIKLINDLMDAMLSPIPHPLNCQCEQPSLMIGRYMKELKGRCLWPRSVLQYSSVSDFLQGKITGTIRPFCLSRYCNFCSDKDFKFMDELRKTKEDFVRQNGGLCLDCVLTGSDSFRKGQCRIKHIVVLHS